MKSNYRASRSLTTGYPCVCLCGCLCGAIVCMWPTTSYNHKLFTKDVSGPRKVQGIMGKPLIRSPHTIIPSHILIQNESHSIPLITLLGILAIIGERHLLILWGQRGKSNDRWCILCQQKYLFCLRTKSFFLVSKYSSDHSQQAYISHSISINTARSHLLPSSDCRVLKVHWIIDA